MVDVQCSKPRTAPAVLALLVIAQHEVSTTQPYPVVGGPVVAQQVKHPGYPQRATHNGKPVVLLAYRQTSPRTEVEGLPGLVQRVCRPRVQQHDGAPGRNQGERSEAPIEQEDRCAQHIAVPGRS